jgi:hypothetical protein
MRQSQTEVISVGIRATKASLAERALSFGRRVGVFDCGISCHSWHELSTIFCTQERIRSHTNCILDRSKHRGIFDRVLCRVLLEIGKAETSHVFVYRNRVCFIDRLESSRGRQYFGR